MSGLVGRSVAGCWKRAWCTEGHTWGGVGWIEGDAQWLEFKTRPGGGVEQGREAGSKKGLGVGET